MKIKSPLLAAVVLLLTEIATAAANKPNFILILMDDFGRNDLGCYTYPSVTNYYPDAGPEPAYNLTPDPDVPTPNKARMLTPAIDTMAAQGIRFTSFYSSEKCSPSRASLMTGRYDSRVSVNVVFRATLNGGLHTEEVTLPEILRQNGYATGMTGKWHLGYYEAAADPFQYMPTRHGFHQFHGVPHSNDMTPYFWIDNESAGEDMKPAGQQAQLTWRYTEAALAFIGEQHAAGKPFFLYVAHSMPHIPVYPSDQTYTNADGTIWPQYKGASGISSYYDIVMEADHSVDRILTRLQELGIDNDTLVLFTSDNGPWLRVNNVDLLSRAVGSAYPLRDSKGTTWEGGVCAPFIARWPGHIPAGRTTAAVGGLVDLLPTLVGLAGGEIPADRTLDGRDLWPLLSGQSSVTPHDDYAVFNGNGSLSSVRKGQWKLREGLLYDLANDIQESADASAANPAIKAELEAAAAAITNSISAEKQPQGTFTAWQVELGALDVFVKKGGTGTVLARLSANPGGAVTVNAARYSGDPDISVRSGSILNFDSSDWGAWQPIILAADETGNGIDGGATIRITSPSINVVREVFVFETDEEVLQPVVASLVWPKTDPAGILDSSSGLIAEGRALVGALTDPAETGYAWTRISGPGSVSFTDASAKKTGVNFSTNGTYLLRLTVDHPQAISSNSVDFTVNVGLIVSGGTPVAPTLAYDATADTDGDSAWENLTAVSGRDWALAAGVTRTLSDPAPGIDGLDAAWNFPGGAIPAGGVSQTMDSYAVASASIELWFRPAALAGAGKQVIWESGGDIGASLVRDGAVLQFVADDSSANVANGGVASAVMAPSAGRDGFLHAVGVIDLNSNLIRLYMDGQEAATAPIAAVADWCGTSHSGLGTIATSGSVAETAQNSNLGGNDQLTGTYGTFAGQIAVMRFYDRALSFSEVADLFNAYGIDDTPGPAGPAVNAGAPQSVAFSDGASLSGSAGDDGLPAGLSLSTLWSQVAGPGIAVFSAPLALATHAAFDLPGEYVLWLEADDSEVKTYARTTITVQPLSYAEWAADIAFPAGQGDPADDADADGQDNGIEFLFGRNPVAADAEPNPLSISSTPAAPDTTRLTVSFDKPRDRAPTVVLQQAEVLDGAWTDVIGVEPEIAVLSPATERWTYTLLYPAANPNGFVRIAVQLP